MKEGKIDELKNHFEKDGWRLHHFYKDGDAEKCFLTEFLAAENKEFLETEYVTLSEKALLHGSGPNYKTLFANEKWVNSFIKNCKDEYGFAIGDEAIQDAFVAAEAKGTPDIWKSARQALGISKPAAPKGQSEERPQEAEGAKEKAEGEGEKPAEPEKKEEEVAA